MKKILVTGCAGFIGYHVTKKLIKLNYKVIGVDNINNYYNTKIKLDRISDIGRKNFKFYKISITNKKKLENIFKKHKIHKIINLAAQAGVRFSIENPYNYIDNNIVGFLNILEFSKKFKVKHLVYASSSSVYGMNNKKTFSIKDPASHPLAIYGVTKRSNELMAHTYSHLYNIPTTGLRYFTVYGPWGRPDMALFKFTKNISNNKPIDLFNSGDHVRDFTYIDDVVELTIRALKKIPKKKTSLSENTSIAPWTIYNICGSRPIHLKKFVALISKELGKKAIIKNLKMQKGDVKTTNGNNLVTIKALRYKPKTNVENGIKKFIEWYKKYNDK